MLFRSVHDLGATELQVGGVDLAPKQLVDSAGTGEDDRLAFNLNGTLAKSYEIGTDTYNKLAIAGDCTSVNTYQLIDR